MKHDIYAWPRQKFHIFTFHTFKLSIDTRRESHLPFKLNQMARQWWHAKVKFIYVFWAWFYRDDLWKYDKNDVKRFSGSGTTFALIMTLNDCLMKMEIEPCVSVRCAIESDCHLYLNCRHNTGCLVTSKMKWLGTLIVY